MTQPMMTIIAFWSFSNSETTNTPSSAPNAVIATPRTMAKKMICSMLPLVSESTGLVGTTSSSVSTVEGETAAAAIRSPAALPNCASNTARSAGAMNSPG